MDRDEPMMQLPTRKYLAFDLETAKQLSGDFSHWRKHRPLGITCAATCVNGEEPRLWYSPGENGKPAARMTRDDVQQLASFLGVMSGQGYTILTWNGASFDFDILAEESGSYDLCRQCAHDHVDMMFHLVCMLGFGVKLAKAAEGLGLAGKADGMTGADAPRLWAAGEYEKVLLYVAQDVRLTLQIAAACERHGEFAWITGKGIRKTKPLAGGWRRVAEALQLPLPDPAQVQRPISREDCLAWMRGHVSAPSAE
jgi:hypothetical protein